MATHSTPRNAKTTITAIGARTKTTSDSQRNMPRRERKKYAATRLTTAAAPPTASIARLLSPAKTSRITIATPASRKLRRASQRCERVPSGLDSGVTAAAGAHVEATRRDARTEHAQRNHVHRPVQATSGLPSGRPGRTVRRRPGSCPFRDRHIPIPLAPHPARGDDASNGRCRSRERRKRGLYLISWPGMLAALIGVQHGDHPGHRRGAQEHRRVRLGQRQPATLLPRREGARRSRPAVSWSCSSLA